MKEQPKILQCEPERIPAKLREQRRWSIWNAEWDPERGKLGKIPISTTNPDHKISTAKVDKWVSFTQAEAALKRFADRAAGLGYVMTGAHGVVGYDLDKCVHDGIVADWAKQIIVRLNSYTEWSPSGKGIRIFTLGAIPRDWTNHDTGVECYGGHAPRFLTITGNTLEGYDLDLADVPSEVHEEIAVRYRNDKKKAEVINLAIPDVLDPMVLPEVHEMGLESRIERFLLEGEHDGDRSAILHSAGIALYSKGLSDDEVFSVLVTNPVCMEIALDKRRQKEDAAFKYLWVEHCLKARGKATRFSVDDFDDVSTQAKGDAAPAPVQHKPGFLRNKHGEIEATIDNVVKGVRSPVVIGMEIRRDNFKDEIVLSTDGGSTWRPFRDKDYTGLRIILERQSFKSVGREMIRDAVEFVASDNEFDTAIFWLEGLPEWDGVPRVSTFLPTFFQADDTPYTRAVSRYLWTALAGRVLVPGIKADMAPILVGLQGTMKSSCVEAMVPGREFFAEIDIDEKREADNSRKMRGTLIAELAELKGLRTKDIEYVKAFISRTHEEWIPKFKEFASQFPRRLVFVGTTNEDQFLSDSTGNRRWLPVHVGAADIEGIHESRNQLWAEARTMFRDSGIAFREAEVLAREVHDNYMIEDAWTDQVRTWLKTPGDFDGVTPWDRDFITSDEVLADAIRLELTRRDRFSQMRVGKILVSMGYVRVRRRVEKSPCWVFTRGQVHG